MGDLIHRAIVADVDVQSIRLVVLREHIALLDDPVLVGEVLFGKRLQAV